MLAGMSCMASPARADLHDLEKQLQSAYEGKTVVLRHFYRGDHLQFHSDGTLIGSVPVGVWTVDGELSVEKISLRPGFIELTGRRIYVAFDSQKKPVDYLTTISGLPRKERKELEEMLRDLNVQVGIELPSQAPEEADVLAAMRAVFLAPGESMMEVVPDYWQNYFAYLEGKPENQPKSSESVTRVNPAAGVSPPRQIHAPEPEYSETARRAKYTGGIVVQLVVDATGTVRDVQIVDPLGIGLDEKAVAAVEKWEFDPATKDGKPVAVLLQVTVTFQLY